MLGNPISLIDPDGRAPSGPGDPPTLYQQIVNYFGFNGFMENTERQMDTVSKMHRAHDAAQTVKHKALDAIESGAQQVGDVAGNVETGAMVVTGASSGASSPVTVPIIAGAEIVGDVALCVEVCVDYARDGKIDQTATEIVIKGAFNIGGRAVDGAVDALDIVGHKAAETTEAVKNIIGVGVDAAEDFVKETFEEH